MINQKKQILIAGATGLIGTELTKTLVHKGYRVMVLTRFPNLVHNEFPDEVGYIEWNGIFTNWLVREAEKSFAVINLAGAGIADKRWTRRRRMQLFRSRIGSTYALAKACQFASKRPDVFIQGSATGFYPFSLTNVFTEDSEPGNSFLSRLCVDWEKVAKHELPEDIRQVIVRTGAVLSSKGGMLPKLILPVKLFAGGWFGTGNQLVSWIHIRDEVNAIAHLLENPNLNGAFNLTAPEPVSQKNLVKGIAKILKRPAWISLPSFKTKWVFGQMGDELLLKGAYVAPKRLVDSGFVFSYPTLSESLNDLLQKS